MRPDISLPCGRVRFHGGLGPLFFAMQSPFKLVSFATMRVEVIVYIKCVVYVFASLVHPCVRECVANRECA